MQQGTFDQFVADLAVVQDEYNAARATNDTAAEKAALAKIDETGAFWIAPTRNVLRADFTRTDKSPDDINVNLDIPTVVAMDGANPNEAIFQQVPRPRVPDSAFQIDEANAMFLGQAGEATLSLYMVNGTYPRDKAYLASLVEDSLYTITSAPFDQYEVSAVERCGGGGGDQRATAGGVCS